MNPLIETLNRCGAGALHFAWPVLWQSSVLIAVLLVSDFVLRRRVRAAVRYALWLVVLVKLLLPPSLALPTSLAWWLFPLASTPAKPHITHFTVSYGDAGPALPPPPAPVFTPPSPPPISVSAWMLLAWGAIGFGLLAWLMVRWRQVMCDVRQASPAPVWLNELFEEARGSANLRQPVCLRLTNQAMSPAVCGLFRPVILLPQSLVDKLSPGQLRAVLLHELIHLRRGDVWLNCAQSLLQIAYWWHPPLWLANARIRRVREEAVDDAVMLALRADAETYAPTLLEVAKLAFHRPLASLGLVGILESRSALRQRIERLVDFHAPRQAGLTLLSFCSICLFSATAVPMGKVPALSPDTNNIDRKESAPDRSAEAEHLVQDAKLLYEMGKLDESAVKLTEALRLNQENTNAFYYLNLVKQARYSREAAQGAPEPQNQAKTQPGLDNRPIQPLPTRIGIVRGRRNIINELNRIRLDKIAFDREPLTQVGSRWFDEIAERTPERISIHFAIDETKSPGEETSLGSVGITINPPMMNARLTDVLDAIVKGADNAIKYSIEDYGVVFSWKGQTSPPLFTRTFKVDTNAFYKHLRMQNVQPISDSGAVRYFLSDAGVDLSAPTTIYLNETKGVLFIRATEPDLEAVEKAVIALNIPPQQIHIKARFVEVPEQTAQYLGTNLIPTGATNVTGILTDPNFRVAIHALEQSKGFENLARPEVTTLSGRHTQMRATDIVTIVTNYVLQEIGTNTAIMPQSGKVELGPVIDTFASVLSDGYTIDLKINTSMIAFSGYDKTTNSISLTNSAGAIVKMPAIHPNFSVRQAVAHVKLWDGQTVVLGGMVESQIQQRKTKVPILGDLPLAGRLFRSESRTETRKNLLVFVTVNLVDPAGNRVHNDEEILFARTGIPPQGSH